MSHRSVLQTLSLSALVAASTTLALGWATDLRAVDDPTRQAEQAATDAQQLAAPTAEKLEATDARVAELAVKVQILPKEKQPNKWRIHFEAHNPTNAKLTTKLLLAVQKTTPIPMARVEPMSEVVYKKSLPIALGPGETIVRDLDLPTGVSWQMTQAKKATEKMEAGGEWKPIASFWVEPSRPDEGPLQVLDPEATTDTGVAVAEATEVEAPAAADKPVEATSAPAQAAAPNPTGAEKPGTPSPAQPSKLPASASLAPRNAPNRAAF